MSDGDVWMMPVMTGVPAVVAQAESAISTFTPGFQGIMVGAQHVEGYGAMFVVGTLAKDGTFQGGATPREHWQRFRDLVNQTCDALAAGAFDQPERSS